MNWISFKEAWPTPHSSWKTEREGVDYLFLWDDRSSHGESKIIIGTYYQLPSIQNRDETVELSGNTKITIIEEVDLPIRYEIYGICVEGDYCGDYELDKALITHWMSLPARPHIENIERYTLFVRK